MADTTDEQLLEQWRQETNMEARDRILEQLVERDLFPQEDTDVIELGAGLYPDVDDPLFIQKIMRKREFAENKQASLATQMEEGKNPCDPTLEFELSPVQRFVARFLSPTTPYNSALLYHGVGVGKTCAAITIAESFLEMYPRKQVIIVAPPNIQPGFERNIYDETKLKIGADQLPNRINGCTGDTYLRLTQTEYERDPKLVTARVARLRRRRYQLLGYTQFYNEINSLLKKRVPSRLSGQERIMKEMEVLRQYFSHRLLIIDEAHNLRDVVESEQDNTDAPGGAAELSDSQAGKKLTPMLQKVLDAAEGLKFVALTATPMYNSYQEIIFLLNLLLRNDKKALLSQETIFQANGSFQPDGERILGHLASSYVSFMRGENPLSFPVRLKPLGAPALAAWPREDPKGQPLPEEDRIRLQNLPFVPCPFTGPSEALYQTLTDTIVGAKGLGLEAVDVLIQGGNFLFPARTDELRERIGEPGFLGCFTEESRGMLKVVRAKAEVPPTWLAADQIAQYSPKAAFLLNRIQSAKGVSFVYSRFVKSGALMIALLLEANGYTLTGRDVPLFANGMQAPGGRQCALCPRKEGGHGAADHAFVAAKYVLLTGRDEYSPNNKGAVDLARSEPNQNGSVVKVVLGSQVASEGIDLRFVRECFVFDSWYHMNKLEQVIGRAIRMCSHALLPKDLRNCTVNLLITSFQANPERETMDMYQYRQGLRKAIQVGRVTRALKRSAVDCNLNRDAIVIQGLPDIEQTDAQGQRHEHVNINDVPYTAMCDWLETCDYQCATPVVVNPLASEDSTYDEYAARWRQAQIRDRFRLLFARQPFYRFQDIERIMEDIPRVALYAFLADIVGNRSFRLQSGSQQGFIVYRNGLYLFQPLGIQDTHLPLSLRVANYPVKRDSYDPVVTEIAAPAVPTAVVAAAPAVGSTGAAGPSVAASATTAAPPEEESLVDPDFETFWRHVVEWARSIQDGRAAPLSTRSQNIREGLRSFPAALQESFRKRYGNGTKEYDRVVKSLMMVAWLYESVKENESLRGELGTATAQMVWDEYLRPAEQYELFRRYPDMSDENVFMRDMWEEQRIASGRTVAFRFLNPNTGVLEYICDGRPCPPSYVAVFETEPSDPLRGLKANTSTTAPIYGTVTYKRGKFIFKTNNPVTPDKDTPAIGLECATLSTTSHTLDILKEVGRRAQEVLRSDLGLNEAEFTRRPFASATKVCALTDISLRLLDRIKAGRARWFYRPISAFKTKHKGTKRTGA